MLKDHDMAGSAAAGRYPVPSTLAPIAVQAMEIITSILDDPSPGLAGIKPRLRRCLADHPGHPEHALLAHLVETSSRVNSDRGRDVRAGEMVSGGEYP